MFRLAKQRGQDATFRLRQEQLQAAFDRIFQTARGVARISCLAGSGTQSPAPVRLEHRVSPGAFLHDPRVPLDSNACARVPRDPVIARYSGFESGGPQGARIAGPLLGVFATLRLNGLNPYARALDCLGAAARNRGEPPGDPNPWLPWRMDERRKQELRRPPVG